MRISNIAPNTRFNPNFGRIIGKVDYEKLKQTCGKDFVNDLWIHRNTLEQSDEVDLHLEKDQPYIQLKNAIIGTDNSCDKITADTSRKLYLKRKDSAKYYFRHGIRGHWSWSDTEPMLRQYAKQILYKVQAKRTTDGYTLSSMITLGMFYHYFQKIKPLSDKLEQIEAAKFHESQAVRKQILEILGKEDLI